MTPYPAYKDSGIEWLGEIPEHWDLQRLKWLVREKLRYGANEAPESEDKNLPRYIRITDFGENGDLKEDTFKSLSPEKAKDYLLTEGDILFARSGATVGKTFQFVNYRGVACFAGYLIKAAPDKEKILSDFLYAFTKSKSYENWKNGIFIQATIQNIGADKYNSLPIPVPPRPEQRAIADFLDHKTRLIDTYVAKKQQQIERLQAYRAALINQAVTKGLDPDVPMKDSGIEWLGEIPAGWEVKKLKFELQSIVGGGTPSTENRSLWGGNIPWVSPKDMKTKIIIDSQDKITELAIQQSSTALIQSNAVLIVVRSGILKHTFPVAINKVAVALNQDMKALTCTDTLNPNYLLHLFKGLESEILLFCTKIGATVDSIDIERFFNFRVPFPPLAEQIEIIDFINTKSAKIDTLIAATQRQIERLQAYRTALISDAVTGKIDVRQPLQGFDISRDNEDAQGFGISRDDRDEEDLQKFDASKDRILY